jgi:biopolymer transport protein ExbD
MPPRIDPYSSKTHKRIDVILVLMTVLLIAFAFRTAAQQRINSAATNIDNHADAAQSQQATSK